MKIGDKVGAVLGSTNEVVEFLGWGTYQGEEVPPKEINEWLNTGRPNPKILLDNGKVVWGCECWWGSEKAVQSYLNGKTVNEVDIDLVRKGAR